MTNNKHALIAWLRAAHAMERASVDNLDRLADRFSRHPQLSLRFREHWRASLGQVEGLETCLKKLGSDTSTFKDLASRFVSIAQAYAGFASLHEPVKDCMATYASMHYKIATYVSLRAAALELAQPQIAQLCDDHLQREREMATWLEEQIPEVTLEFLRP